MIGQASEQPGQQPVDSTGVSQRPPERYLPRIDGAKLTKLLTLAMCGILAGAVLAAAAFPIVGLTGLTAKVTSDSFQNLPDTLKEPPIPQTSMLYTSDGTFITSFSEEHRVYIKLNEIPQVMQDAIVASEDQRFFHHAGVDPQGVIRALLANREAGEVTQGASTLTQQYVKQLLQYSAKTKAERKAAIAPTIARKLREARFALAIEEKYTKKEILERYLNIAFFGNKAYGIYAAAEAYFSKQPKDLTLAEAALLAGLVQSPTRYNPMGEGKAEARERRNYVLDRMARLKFATKDEIQQAKDEEIQLNPKVFPNKCENAENAGSIGFACGWFVDWWVENPQFGATRKERLSNLERGGYRLKLAIDMGLQDAAQRAIDSQLSSNNALALGEVVIEPNTGRVKVMAINRHYSIDTNPNGRDYPNTTNPLLSGSSSSPGYQAGSTFKAFTMVAAIEKGMPLDTAINSPQKYASKYPTGPGPAACGGRRANTFVYCPENASKSMTGNHTMWSGFGESVNTYFMQLQERVGVKAAIDAAEKLGITLEASNDVTLKEQAQESELAWGAFTLGTAQVSPLEMANAYATLAARGLRCQPQPLQEVTDVNGRKLPFAEPNCEQVIPQDVADAAVDAMRCPVGQSAAGSCVHPGGGATAPSVGATLKRPVAGKTGTTDGNNAAWFVGFTPNLAGAVFKANPDSPNQNVGDTQDPIQVFNATFLHAFSSSSLPEQSFVPPIRSRVTNTKGSSVDMPNVEGSSIEEAKSRLANAGFSTIVSPRLIDSDKPKDTVIRTDPPAGSRAPNQATITLYVSSGRKPPK